MNDWTRWARIAGVAWLIAFALLANAVRNGAPLFSFFRFIFVVWTLAAGVLLLARPVRGLRVATLLVPLTVVAAGPALFNPAIGPDPGIVVDLVAVVLTVVAWLIARRQGVLDQSRN